MQTGSEWLIDATGCRGSALADLATVRGVCERVVAELGLHVVGEPQWRQFPDPGGVTGLYLLTESHLACHTFPELEIATFNLYCCRDREAWNWQVVLTERLGARRVIVRNVVRGAAAARHANDRPSWLAPSPSAVPGAAS